MPCVRNEILSNLLLGCLLGALVYLGCEQVVISRKMLLRMEATMTDPGPMELKAAWITGYDGGIPIYHTVSVTRNAPTETVTHWIEKFEAAVHADLIAFPPYGG